MSQSRKIVYVDDSGDAGFDFVRGSSRYLVIALVVFNDEIDAEETDVIIKKYRRSLGWPVDVEFKFHKTRAAIRSGFLREVRKGTYTIRAVLVDKTLLKDSLPRQGKASFYNFIIKEVLSRNEDLGNAQVFIDGKAENEYRKSLKAYLRKNLSTKNRAMADIRFVNSKNNSLIQLADMVAGAIRRTAETDKTDYHMYYDIIKKKISDLWRYTG